MPTDNDKRGALGRTYRGETSPPITTPEAVATVQATRAMHNKPGAIPLHVYFVSKGIDSPILQASMAAYTDVKVATVEAFDKIFDSHHNVVIEGKKP